MPNRHRLIPFQMLPASWGLSGRPREEAEANYYLYGYELTIRLAEIENGADRAAYLRAKAVIDHEYGLIDEYERDKTILRYHTKETEIPDPRKMLEIKLKYKRIDQYHYDLGIAKIEHPDGVDQKLALLEVDRKHDKIDGYSFDTAVVNLTTKDDSLQRKLALIDIDRIHGKVSKLESEKRSATLRDMPWVGVIDQGFDIDQGIDGLEFEFDWNKQWIDYLRMAGYTGMSEQDIVESWFSDVCRNPGGVEDSIALPMASRRLPI